MKDLTNQVLFLQAQSFWEHTFLARMQCLKNGWPHSAPPRAYFYHPQLLKKKFGESWQDLLLGGGQLLSWRTVDCWILSTLGSVLCNCPASNPNWTRSKRKVNKSLYLLDNKALKGWWGCPSQLLTVQAVLSCWTHIINQSISQFGACFIHFTF